MPRLMLFPILLAPLAASADFHQKPIAHFHPTDSDSCPHPHISCPTSIPSDLDTCCLNHPSGHFLLTQFWDTSPSLGPADSWTIHGLWPDRCHGGFEQYCDSSRSHSDIKSILGSSPDLLDFMSKYWLSINGDNSHLWSHEWNKHGTCISTLEPSCYPASDYQNDKDLYYDVVDYFTHAATLFSTLSTYDALAASNIIPSNSRAYDLDDLQSAISTLQGAEVTFRCHGHELQEIWYHFNVHGPLRDAPAFSNESIASTESIAAAKHKFRAVDPDGSKTNCPATGIRYLPKEPHQPLPSHTSATTSSSTSTPTSTSTPFSGKGHLLVRPISTDSSSSSSTSSVKGCLIRSGAWYLTSGSSCASYIAKSDPKHLSSPSPSDELSPPRLHWDERTSGGEDEGHLFTLSSLYAPCAVIPSAFPDSGGLFMCQKNLGIQSIFSSVCDDDDDGDSASISTNAADHAGSNSSAMKKECKSGKHKLAHLGKTTFYADSVPAKLEKVGIYVDDKDGEREVEVEILWEAL